MDPMAAGDSFYITTPIFYVNDVPHIGHAYTEVAADVLARWHRQRGDDTWLLTGTDEHGQKILRTAVANDTTPQEWADKLVDDALEAAARDRSTSRNDDFIRTTDERHEKGVRDLPAEALRRRLHLLRRVRGLLLRRLRGVQAARRPHGDARGDYEGQLVCAIHSRPVELLKETNYFFRMSDFEQRLLDLYESQPDFIQPESVRNEIIAVRQAGPRRPVDLALELRLGHQDPVGRQHVVYVWFDALLNYVTADRLRRRRRRSSQRRWPAMHIVGKDIARFHAVIWPAMLHGRGARGAAARLRPRLAARRRREDVASRS